jgi:hypothetical protein
MGFYKDEMQNARAPWSWANEKWRPFQDCKRKVSAFTPATRTVTAPKPRCGGAVRQYGGWGRGLKIDSRMG